MEGTVYLLHFLEPIGNPTNPHAMAQHYIGWALVAAERISTQTAGQGAAIVRHVQAQGIGFLVAATWPGTRALGAPAQEPQARLAVLPDLPHRQRQGPREVMPTTSSPTP